MSSQIFSEIKCPLKELEFSVLNHFGMIKFFIPLWVNCSDFLSYQLFERADGTCNYCASCDHGQFQVPIWLGKLPKLESVHDFLIKLDMKPCMHLVEISFFLKSCHHQNYQNHEQSQQKWCTILETKVS